MAVEFIHRAHGLDARLGLGYPCTIGKTGRAAVTGPGIYTCQTFAHNRHSESITKPYASKGTTIRCAETEDLLVFLVQEIIDPGV